MNGGPKDNANPVVLSVAPRRRSKKNPLGWREVQAYMGTTSCGGHTVNDGDGRYDDENAVEGKEVGYENGMKLSIVDQAVLQALTDVSRATNGDGVGLLRRVGWVIPPKASIANLMSQNMFCNEDGEEEDSSVEVGMEIDGKESTMKRDRLAVEEVFEIIRNIQDPEHPLTLEQLGVVSCEQIEVSDEIDGGASDDDDGDGSFVNIRFTPTIPACSMATLIGLAIKVKLQRSLPSRFKVSVRVERGTHQSEQSINKQLADKERVCAALENPHLLKVMNRCIHNGMTGKIS